MGKFPLKDSRIVSSDYFLIYVKIRLQIMNIHQSMSKFINYAKCMVKRFVKMLLTLITLCVSFIISFVTVLLITIAICILVSPAISLVMHWLNNAQEYQYKILDAEQRCNLYASFIKKKENDFHVTIKHINELEDPPWPISGVKRTRDCWGNEYQLNCQKRIVYSKGPDGHSNPENEDDPVNRDDIKVTY